MKKFIQNHPDLVFGVFFVGIVLAGLIGYFTGRIGMIDRIHTNENKMISINEHLANLKEDIEEIKKNIEPMGRIDETVKRIDSFVKSWRDSEPERIWRERKFRDWQRETDEKLKKLEASDDDAAKSLSSPDGDTP